MEQAGRKAPAGPERCGNEAHRSGMDNERSATDALEWRAKPLEACPGQHQPLLLPGTGTTPAKNKTKETESRR